jgi:hypothetical protein
VHVPMVQMLLLRWLLLDPGSEQARSPTAAIDKT